MGDFKFIIQWPKHEIASDEKYQTFTIMAKYPQHCYRAVVKKNSTLTDDEQRRLAISELKVRLIQDISNAEFELVDDL